jgi:hypothetical protein
VPSIINNNTVRAEEVARRNGGHTEHLIHRGKISMQWPFFFVLVYSIAIKIKMLLTDQILDHFLRHPVFGEEYNLRSLSL